METVTDPVDGSDRQTSGQTGVAAPVTPGHTHDERQASPDICDNKGTIAQGGNAEVHDRTGLYIAIIALLFAAMAFGMSIVLPMVYSERMEAMRDRVQIAERNAQLAREDVRIMQLALAARGIETDEHAQEKRK